MRLDAGEIAMRLRQGAAWAAAAPRPRDPELELAEHLAGLTTELTRRAARGSVRAAEELPAARHDIEVAGVRDLVAAIRRAARG